MTPPPTDAAAPIVRSAAFADLSPPLLYALLRLRTDVFVVEQRCPYPELDGRDTEPDARHWWVEEEGRLVACLRVLREDDGSTRLGRVVTAPDARGRGRAAALVRAALVDAPRPVVIDAQAHLVDWYRSLGFEVTGELFVEDGIDHLPMQLG